jgi:excisionase family DNA binding protein
MRVPLSTVAEAAKELKVSKSELYGLIRRGTIPSYRLGSIVRINLDELLEIMRKASVRGPEGRSEPAKTLAKS